VQALCRARVGATSYTVGRVVLFLVLLRAAEAAAERAGTATDVVLVEALGALNGFRLDFDNCGCDSRSKDL
jgi:hypothetical protein